MGRSWPGGGPAREARRQGREGAADRIEDLLRAPPEDVVDHDRAAVWAAAGRTRDAAPVFARWRRRWRCHARVRRRGLVADVCRRCPARSAGRPFSVRGHRALGGAGLARAAAAAGRARRPRARRAAGAALAPVRCGPGNARLPGRRPPLGLLSGRVCFGRGGAYGSLARAAAPFRDCPHHRGIRPRHAFPD